MIAKGDGTKTEAVQVNLAAVDLVGDDHFLSCRRGRLHVLEQDHIAQRVFTDDEPPLARALRSGLLVRISTLYGWRAFRAFEAAFRGMTFRAACGSKDLVARGVDKHL